VEWTPELEGKCKPVTFYVDVREEKKALEALLRCQDKASPGRPRGAPKVSARSRTPASPKSRGEEKR